MSLEPKPEPLPIAARLPTQPMGIWDSYQAARRNILDIIPERALHQPTLSGQTGPQRWHMIQDPAAIRTMLVDHVDRYPKSEATKSILRPAIGDGLFVAEGAHWRWQRRAAAPAFSARNVAALTPVMTRAADASADRLARSVGRAVNVLDEMVAATFDVISDVTFGDGPGVDRAGVSAALDAYIDRAARVSVLDVLGLPDWLPRPGRAAAARDLADMSAGADAAIEARRRTGPRATPDLLDLLLDALPLTRAIVEETLRLYPAGGFLSRTASVDDRLGHAIVRPGDTVMIPVYALHRHRRLWQHPDAFWPARWMSGDPVDRFQYLPFGDGPRICIGARFAMQEATVILATLLARFRFTAVRGRVPKPVMILTLRPEGGVWLEVEAV